jgi:hypothetical protein
MKDSSEGASRPVPLGMLLKCETVRRSHSVVLRFSVAHNQKCAEQDDLDDFDMVIRPKELERVGRALVRSARAYNHDFETRYEAEAGWWSRFRRRMARWTGASERSAPSYGYRL